MTTRNQINFLSGKIQELGTAIMTFQDSKLLRFPSLIVEIILVDERGCVWLAVNNSSEQLSRLNKNFHVALKFYKKGKSFFLNTNGIARMVIESAELQLAKPLIKREMEMGKTLLCIHIIEASYHEFSVEAGDSFLQKVKQSISSLFAESNQYTYFRFKDHQHFA